MSIMQTTATTTPTALSPAAPAVQPMVMLEGVPEPGLRVRSYVAEAPLDARTARCTVDPVLWGARRALRHRRATLAIPHALADGTTRWEVLMEGVLREPTRDVRSGGDTREIELVDDWVLRLLRPIAVGWVWSADALARALSPKFEVGDRANRSHARHLVNGRWVYVLEHGGAAWTLGDALDTAVAFADLPLKTEMLSDALRGRALGVALDLTEPAGDVLRRLLGALTARVRCERWRSGQAVRVCQALVPASSGRRFWLPWGGDTAGVSRVGRVKVAGGAAPPRRWVIRGARPEVESAFELVAGWDPALAGAADSEYGRATSSDFAAYGAVFRRWVLNEDGAFSGPPHGAGPAFDLAGLFDDPRVVAMPVRFERCLTRDASGRRFAPVVEVSTDGGSAWSRYDGAAQVMPDRAGVLLDDAVLPSAVLAAAQAGQLRLRVTATLRSPRVLEATRWRGNPFAGPGPDQVLERGAAYRWQRVDSASIHADAIDLGELEADEVDDRPKLSADLLAAVLDDDAAVSGEVELIGAWPSVGVGDRVLDLGGPGVGADGVPTSVEEGSAVVTRVAVRFGVSGDAPMTRLGLG